MNVRGDIKYLSPGESRAGKISVFLYAESHCELDYLLRKLLPYTCPPQGTLPLQTTLAGGGENLR